MKTFLMVGLCLFLGRMNNLLFGYFVGGLVILSVCLLIFFVKKNLDDFVSILWFQFAADWLLFLGSSGQERQELLALAFVTGFIVFVSEIINQMTKKWRRYR